MHHLPILLKNCRMAAEFVVGFGRAAVGRHGCENPISGGSLVAPRAFAR
jgi:hypothetical protein